MSLPLVGAVGREFGRGVVRRGEVEPGLGDAVAYGDLRVVAGDVVELVDVDVADDDVLRVAAVDAVAQVGGPEHRRRRDEDRAELHHREDGLPQLDLVGQHEDHPVAAAHALRPQPVGDAVRALAHVGERVLRLPPVLLDDPQRRTLRGAGVRADGVEVLESPVELVELRPREVAQRGVEVLAPLQQEIPRPAELRRGLAELRHDGPFSRDADGRGGSTTSAIGPGRRGVPRYLNSFRRITSPTSAPAA